MTAALQRGDLVCLGLVCTRSANPLDLGENHQVLAYRMVRDGADVRVWVYDPNRPGVTTSSCTCDRRPDAGHDDRLRERLEGRARLLRHPVQPARDTGCAPDGTPHAARSGVTRRGSWRGGAR